MPKARILVVEDEAIIAKDLEWRLKSMGYEVPFVVASGEEAITRAEESKPDLILMDIMLPGAIDGIEAANQIRAKADIPIIYLTAYVDEEILERAKITEPFGYLIKPIGDRELHSNIELSIHKHKIDKKLRENEKWLSTVLSSIGDAVITTDTKGYIMSINPAAETLTGWKAEEAIGRPVEEIFNIIDEGTGKRAENPVKKILEKGATFSSTDHPILITKNGNKISIANSSAPIQDEKGNITGVVFVFRSIVERKKVEALILQAKHDWEETFDTITDMITIHDKDFNIIRANKAAQKILGLPILDFNEAKCFKYYHGTDHPPKGCPSCQCLHTRHPSIFEIFEPHLNMFVEIRAIPRLDSNNNLIGLIHIVRDITERKKIENEIRKAKAEWEMTFDNANELILLVDKDFKISRVNKSFAQFVKKQARELIGKKCSDFFPCDAIQGDETKTISNVEIQTNSGHWLYLSSYSIFDEKGEFLHRVIIATDITDLKRTQQRLMKSEEELKNRVEELENFYEMAIGRELKMKELKNEITRLKKRLKECEEKLAQHKT